MTKNDSDLLETLTAIDAAKVLRDAPEDPPKACRLLAAQLLRDVASLYGRSATGMIPTRNAYARAWQIIKDGGAPDYDREASRKAEAITALQGAFPHIHFSTGTPG